MELASDFEALLVEEEPSWEIRLWKQALGRCSACWIGHEAAQFEQGLGLQAHHLVKRSRRRCDELWNLLLLCERCHRLAELETIRDGEIVLPKLTFSVCLWIKRETEPDCWVAWLLRELYGEPLPELEPLPDWFERERQRRYPIRDWRTLA